MMRGLYVVVCLASLAFVAANSLFGIEFFGDTARTDLPNSVRQSPGGFRSFIYWHSGYQGGK